MTAVPPSFADRETVVSPAPQVLQGNLQGRVVTPLATSLQPMLTSILLTPESTPLAGLESSSPAKPISARLASLFTPLNVLKTQLGTLHRGVLPHLEEHMQQLHRMRRELLCTPLTEDEREAVQHKFYELFLTLVCHLNPCTFWPTLVSDFDFSPSEQLSLAKEVVLREGQGENTLGPNIQLFQFSPQQRTELAFFLVEHKKNIAAYIDRFDLPLESDRFQIAFKLLTVFETDLISLTIQKFGLQTQELSTRLALEASQKPSKRKTSIPVLQALEHYGVKDEEKVVQILLHCAKSYGSGVLEYLGSMKVSTQQKLQVVRALLMKYPDVLGLVCTLGTKLQVSPSEMQTFLLSLKETHSNGLYELLYRLPIDPIAKEQLKRELPLFPLDQKITALVRMPCASFAALKTPLESVLRELHERSLHEYVPYMLYKFAPNNLSQYLHDIASTLPPQELVQLIELVTKHFFPGTDELLDNLYTVAQIKIPRLNEYLGSDVTKIHQVALSPVGVTYVATEKLERKGIPHTVVAIPPVFDISVLSERVNAFQNAPEQKALFIVQFKKGHFSPLILEKRPEGMFILNSDSVFSGAAPFTQMVVQELQKVQFPTKIFVVPYQRQHDFSSCPIFSLSDLVEAMKIIGPTGRSFFDYFLEHAQISKGRVGSYDVQNVEKLPAEMMKMAQSITAIHSVAHQSPTFMRKESPYPLEKYVIEEHSYMVKEEGGYKKRTMVADIQRAHYFLRILNDLASGHISLGSPESKS